MYLKLEFIETVINLTGILICRQKNHKCEESGETQYSIEITWEGGITRIIEYPITNHFSKEMVTEETAEWHRDTDFKKIIESLQKPIRLPTFF